MASPMDSLASAQSLGTGLIYLALYKPCCRPNLRFPDAGVIVFQFFRLLLETACLEQACLDLFVVITDRSCV